MPAGSSSIWPQPDPLLENNESDAGSSSEDVTEDEDGIDLTPALDAAILKTLGKIRRGEGVYGEENVLQEAMREAEIEASRKGIRARAARGVAEKPYRLADYHREALLSGGDLRNPDEEEQEPLTYVEGERRMRNDAVTAFTAFAAEEEDEADESFIPVKRTEVVAEGGEDEDEEYRKFLLDMGGGEATVRDVLGVQESEVHEVASPGAVEPEQGQEKKKKRKAKKAKQDDDFLMNYILNRGWIEKEDKPVPTYDEITAPKSKPTETNGEAGPSHPWGTLEEEEEFDDQADAFEAAYNFRFEEPGSSNIVSHPRSFPSLVRRPDDARAVKRAARAERKAAQKAAYEEKVRAEKGKKRREMEKRLESLKKDVGDKMDWEEVEKLMEGDYDEGQWDEVVGRMMVAMDQGEDDDGKPTWDDDDDDFAYGDDEGEDPELNGDEVLAEDEAEAEDGPINMDADFNDLPAPKKRKKSKKGKHREPSPELLEDDQHLSVNDKAAKVKQAIREYQSLDHEDTIGDLPTRFKYTKGASTDFGLTPVEILLATDAELNALMSVKTIAPYRQGGLGASGKGLGKKVRELKEELRKRRWGEEYKPEKEKDPAEERRRWLEKHKAGGAPKRKREDGENGEGRPGKRRGKKERMAAKANGGVASVVAEAEASLGQAKTAINGDGDGEKKKRRKKKKHTETAV